MKLPKEKTAIVLIEPQNDFLSKGGTMFQYIEDQLKERGVIGNLQKLLKGARGKVKIFYCPFEAFQPGFPELKPTGPGTGGLRGIEMEMKADWGTGAWVAGTPGPEIIKELTPEKGDIVIRGKMTLDAFHSTPLNYLLRANEIEHVAFTGFHTNWCVESSARSAYDHGYRVTVISDCTATDTEREQKYAEEVIFPKIGTVMTADQFLEALE
ncbi:cysteine hydrolase family protein [Breznakiella homolactica]|uniref:Cysteine hydrolase n=1 Tax=Breznakiella homolactica TaxID=2798577 RepID=A0A7T8B8W9_9SPIR|nr:cysteine hydrolase [Breznakiella homolactica]QQO07832.1 cysteine hydrolase [Breznakiella homolactica]